MYGLGRVARVAQRNERITKSGPYGITKECFKALILRPIFRENAPCFYHLGLQSYALAARNEPAVVEVVSERLVRLQYIILPRACAVDELNPYGCIKP